jgi:DNA topoisomerase II
VEPVFFLPILPMLLVNGCAAIATGWASDIPSYNIRVVIAMLKKKLLSPPSSSPPALTIKTEPMEDVKGMNASSAPPSLTTPVKTTLGTPLGTPLGALGTPLGTPTSASLPKAPKISPHSVPRIRLPENELQPYYRGFLGTVEYERESNRFWVCGKYKIEDIGPGQKCIVVEEIPVDMCFDQYMKLLQKLKDKEAITDYEKKILSYDDHLHFHIFVTTEQLAKLQVKFLAPLKLAKTIKINPVAFDERGRITPYRNVQEIFDAYYKVRLPYYELRKVALLKELNEEHKLLMNKARFIQMIIDGKMDVSAKEEFVYDVLDELKFDRIVAASRKKAASGDESDKEEEEDRKEGKEEGKEKKEKKVKHEEASDSTRKQAYRYLMNISLIQQTEEQFQKLQAKCQDIARHIDRIQKKTIEEMWLEELDELSEELSRVEEMERKERENEMKNSAKSVGKSKPSLKIQSPSKVSSKPKVSSSVKLEPVVNKQQKRKASGTTENPKKRQKTK